MPELFDFSSMPILQSDRLILREVRPDGDLPAFFQLFADPRVAEFTDTGPFTGIGEAVDVLTWIAKIFEDQQGMRWAITNRTNQAVLLGTCGFNRWHRWNNSAEIGYDLAYEHWGNGVMTEAVQTVLRFGFENMGLNRVEADVTLGNDGSARVLEKLGFVEEGLLRQRGFWRDRYHDLRLFSLLRADYEQQRFERRTLGL